MFYLKQFFVINYRNIIEHRISLIFAFFIETSAFLVKFFIYKKSKLKLVLNLFFLL